MSKILNLKDHELDLLADFLGHDIRVHREFYPLPEHTLQVAKISKLLMAMESGEITKQAGKNLDEITFDADEEIDMDINYDEEEDEVDDVGDDNQCNEDDGSFNAMVVRKAPVVVRRQGPVKEVKRVPWSKSEEAEINEYFKEYVELTSKRRCPGMQECMQAIHKSKAAGGQEWKRSWETIKKKVSNMMKMNGGRMKSVKT